MKVAAIHAVRCGIGEGAVWDEKEQRLYLADVLANQVVRYDPVDDAVKRFDVGQIIGSLALDSAGGAVLGLATGVHLFDFDGTPRPLVDLEPHDRSLLVTEGKADPTGRFVVATFGLAMSAPVGSLYAVEASGSAKPLRRDIVVPNGLAWSPDGNTMYFADSALNTVYAYDYDAQSGAVTGERKFVDTSDLGGIPDGATVDAIGNYWVTICQAGIVACFSPDGILQRQIEFPTKWVSSLAFGGENLDRLFVTSLNPAQMNMGEDPQGGTLFVADNLGVRGLPSYRFQR